MIAGLPLPIVWTALVIGLAWLAVAVVAMNVAGGLDGVRVGGRPFWEHPLLLYEPFYGLSIGWAMVLPVAFLRASSTCSAELRPALAASAGEVGRDPMRELLPSKTWLRAAGGLALVLAPVGDFFWFSSLSESLWPERPLRWLVFGVVQDACLGWFAFRGIAVLLAVGQQFSTLGRELRVDVLDLRPIAPIGALGLQLALLMLVAFALGAPLIGASLLIESREIGILVALSMCLPLALGGVVLILPTRGVRQAILRAKDAELDRVRGEIAREREAALGPSGEQKRRSSETLAGLLAYEERVLSVRAWPFDLPVLLRLAAYTLLPLASWIAAAVVERALDRALE